MIVKTDAMNVSLNNAGTFQGQPAQSVTQNAPGSPKPSRESAQGRLKTAAQRLGVERALGDALSIAQMSQNIIQQAISISQRLRGIAAEAMSTGRVDAGALSEVMAGMRNALGNYGGDVAAPLRTYAVHAGAALELPDIRGELRSLNDVGAGISAGNFTQGERIEATARSLSEKMTAFKRSEEKIINLMRETGASNTGIGSLTAREMASRASSIIVNNPSSALAAQGNISYSAADRLMA